MPDLVRVDLDTFQAWKGARLLALRVSDMRILVLLVRRAGRAVTHEQLYRAGWGDWRAPSTRAVANAVSRIRAEIGGECIDVIRGVGYRFVPSMVAPGQPQTVVIEGEVLEVIHWERHDASLEDRTRKWTLHARPLPEVADA